MNANSSLLESILQKIFDCFGNSLSENFPNYQQSPISKQEYINLAIALDAGTISEENLNTAFRTLKDQIRKFIQSVYLPAFQLIFSTEINNLNYLKTIEQYNKIIINLQKLKEIIRRFFVKLDSKTYQKMYAMEKTSSDCFDCLFKEMVIAKYKVQFIKLIFIFFVENYATDCPEIVINNFVLFLRTFSEFANNQLFSIEKLKKEIENEIKKVFEAKTKAFYQSVVNLNVSEFLNQTAKFKSQVRLNVRVIIDQIPLLQTLKYDIQTELNKNLLDNIINRLIQNEFREISQIMDQKNIESLKNIYVLFLDCEEKIEKFKDFFTRFITQRSLRIMSVHLSEQKEVDDLITFLLEIDDIISAHFQGNKNLKYSMNKAIELVVSELSSQKNKIQNEYFINRIFSNLKRKIEKQEIISNRLEKLSDIISYISVKSFDKNITAFLTKRILNFNYRKTNFDSELSILSLFRAKMGDECCAHLISILKDMHDFQTRNAGKFETFKNNMHSTALNQSELNLTLVSKYDHIPPFGVIEPMYFRFFSKIINDFFTQMLKSDNQQLELDFTFGFCETEIEFNSGKCTISGNPVYSILMMFISDKEIVSFHQIVNGMVDQQSIRVTDFQKDIQFYLNQLLEIKVIVKIDNLFSINKSFFVGDKGLFALKYIESQQEDQPAETEEKSDRNYEFESRIMRSVKSRQYLVDELKNSLMAEMPYFEITGFRNSLQFLLQSELIVKSGINQESVKFN